MAATAPIIAVILLPSFTYRGTSISLWHLPASFTLEPLGVAVLGLCAGVLMARGRVSGRRWLAAGMLLAFGAQTLLYGWGTQFGLVPPDKPGSAGIAGIVGGLMLVAAGVLGAVGNAEDRTTSDLASNQGIRDLPNAF